MRTKLEVVNPIALFGRAASPIVEYIQAEPKAIKMGANPKTYHHGLTRHFSHPENKRFTPCFPPVTLVTTSAARLGVQEAMAISKPIKTSDIDVKLTTAPMIKIVIRKNR